MDEKPWIRIGSVFARAAHLVAACAIGGACLLSVEAPLDHAWWILVGVSGALLLAAEWIRHPDLHRVLAGWATVLKLALLGGIALAPAAAPWLVAAAIVVSALGAHLPRRWRHRRLI